MNLTVCSLRGRVMIAQWENECISLSVLSEARVMTAQWENKWVSLSVLSEARVMTAQWENDCISLSVLSEARVMIAQWENGLTCIPFREDQREEWQSFSLMKMNRCRRIGLACSFVFRAIKLFFKMLVYPIRVSVTTIIIIVIASFLSQSVFIILVQR